jgi:hypothetical protein
VNASRLARIPIAHVIAEVAAYPLASEAGLLLTSTNLCPRLSGDTLRLWRSAEQDLLRANPAVALDELVAIRDDIWFHMATEPISLSTYLRSLANRFLVVRGAGAFPQLDLREAGPPLRGGDGVARTFWRWLSFALPPDLFLAALGNGGQYAREMQTYSPLLDRRLRDLGFAEPHVHLNGCFDFDSIWVGTMHGLADPTMKHQSFVSPGGCLNEGKHLSNWLLRTALARYVLAAFLIQRRGGQEVRIFLRDRVFSRVRDTMGPAEKANLVRALEDLRDGNLSSTQFTVFQFLYSRMIAKHKKYPPREPEEVWDWDPIAPLLGGVESPPEVRFLARALHYLDSAPKDRLFAQLFWQVVRVRCLYYRHLVQRPMTPGLQWFVRFFRRIKPARSLFRTHVKGRIAASLCGAEHGLRSLEVRSSPESNTSETLHEVLDLDEALRRKGERGDEAPFEFGVVWHFGRDREGGWFKGKPSAHWSGTAADPSIRRNKESRNPIGYRYGLFYKQQRKTAMAAARVLALFPRTLEIVRGLDLCTDEVGVPIWVMAPLVRYVQDAGSAASAVLHERLSLSVPSLNMTVHAGEDFVHLLSGLRRLDEAIDHLKLGEGDRIGHALSLGVDAEEWGSRAGRVPVPREERLLDLAWEWAWYARCAPGAPSGRQALLQAEISEHTRSIFGQELTPWQVGQLVQDLHNEASLSTLGFPDRPYPKVNDDRSRWVLLYLTNPVVFKRGREILWIDPKEEAGAIRFLQTQLREKVGRMGLTIEVNPSSNLLIGNLGDVENHPLWNLCPPVSGGEAPPLSVCIGSDDPLTFATTLRQEYQLLYDALVQQGNAEIANAWLERARSAGLNARFTLPESRRLWDHGQPRAGRADPGREALTFSPLGWTAKLDLPP